MSFPMVGIGASAGGLEAFTQLLSHLPTDTGMGFILIQHLDPAHESALTELLGKTTLLPVCEVTNEMPVQPNRVYVIPPNTNLTIKHGVLKLQPRRKTSGQNRSIDFFLESLAQDQQERAIGVILSGTATDGTQGLEAIKAEGGITFSQDESAKYDSMPRSAVATGCVDFVLSPENIAKELARIATHPFISVPARKRRANTKEIDESDDLALSPPVDDAAFKKILIILRNHCGVDFSLYKATTIKRRVTRRMVLNKQSTLDDYANFLRCNAGELNALYSDALISVTSFFRNPEVFEALKRKVFPRLVQQKRDELLRVWVLGCSSGQEAYSIAMCFAEFCDKIGKAPKLQVFATDINETLLDKARHGLYPKNIAQDVSPERLRRFFTEEEGGYRVTKTLREACIFARQNLISDPPFSRMDLISCRNLMIYLEPGLQKKILPTFHYALKPEGFLLLGASESVGSFTQLFEPVDKKQKIFAKKPAAAAFHLPLSGGRATERKELETRKITGTPAGFHDELNVQREADRLTVNRFAPAGVLIDAEMQILQFRGPTDAYLTPPTGKASFNVLKMAREGLMLPLRAAINKARKEKQRVRRENIPVSQDGRARSVNVEVIPLKNLKELCYLIFFEEKKEGGLPAASHFRAGREAQAEPRAKASEGRGASQSHRVAELERELSEARDYLQSVQEQHDAASEELQASSEELQSANEELQSINEELETSKEELQSTNEELITVNEEMANRNVELNRLNSDLLNLQNSVHTAIVLLGRDLTIRRFTSLAEKMFNLLATDIGRPLGSIKVGFDFPNFENWVGEVINTMSVREREVQDSQGKWYSLRARPYLTLDNKIDGAVLMLVDINALKQAEKKASEALHYAEAVIDDASPLLILDEDLRVISGNRSFYIHFQVSRNQTENRLIYELGNGQWNIPQLRSFLEEILPQSHFFKDFEVTHDFEDIGRKTILLSGRRLDHLHRILLFIDDITERRAAEASLRQNEERYRTLFNSIDEGFCIIEMIFDKRERPFDYRFLQVNPSFEKQTGLSHVQGKRISELAPGQEQHWFEIYGRIALTGESARFEHRADGLDRWFDVFAFRFGAAENRQVAVLFNDITERKRSEEKLREQQEKITRHAGILEETVIERTEKLQESVKSLEGITYTMAHDLRTPIRTMISFASALVEDVPLNETGKDYAERIQNAAARMDQLVNDLLEYSQLTHQEFPFRAIDLRKEIEKTIASIAEDIQTNRATIDVVGTMYVVRANETLLDQVLSNLILNALKFVAPGVAPRVVFRAEKRDSVIRLWVEDNGIGIAPEYQAKIFEVFQRLHTTDEFPGTGVGLAITRRALERMDGNVGVESQPGKGSRFWIELPEAKLG